MYTALSGCDFSVSPDTMDIIYHDNKLLSNLLLS
nr:MAG TPA: hypothetical protein [Caudoviricetes sp.]